MIPLKENMYHKSQDKGHAERYHMPSPILYTKKHLSSLVPIGVLPESHGNLFSCKPLSSEDGLSLGATLDFQINLDGRKKVKLLLFHRNCKKDLASRPTLLLKGRRNISKAHGKEKGSISGSFKFLLYLKFQGVMGVRGKNCKTWDDQSISSLRAIKKTRVTKIRGWVSPQHVFEERDFDPTQTMHET